MNQAIRQLVENSGPKYPKLCTLENMNSAQRAENKQLCVRCIVGIENANVPTIVVGGFALLGSKSLLGGSL
jgi:hypothetical protein